MSMARVTRKPTVDWFRILSDLRKVGMTQVHIARALQVTRRKVRGWADGCSPRYEDGRALLFLWRREYKARMAKNVPKAGVKPSEHERTHTPAEWMEASGVSTPALALS